MKFALAVLAISICCFGLIEAGPYRGQVRITHCKEPTTISPEGWASAGVSLADCPSIVCNAGYKWKEDLSKPYPGCCAKCVPEYYK